jgi:microcystin-dependent protein
MSQPFLGQVIPVGFNFAPQGWALCDGSLLSISQYSALFSLIGTYYGGDGVTTFGLPDLRGRVIAGTGSGPGLSPYTIGQSGGQEAVTLSANQLAGHTHVMVAAPSAELADPASNAVFGTNTTTGVAVTATSGTQTSLIGTTVSQAGGSAPHENRQPYTTINYIIALNGIYPSRS